MTAGLSCYSTKQFTGRQSTYGDVVKPETQKRPMDKWGKGQTNAAGSFEFFLDLAADTGVARGR